ncbi:MAG: hypothetical protein KY475_18275 [Planctomycetes bacterium]|nr:hypothetical protein [Planctomycetota bacterium]
MGADEGKNASSRWPRFDLFSVLEAMAGIAFFCALLAGSGGRAEWTYRFSRMPSNDLGLLDWMADQGMENVAIAREELTLAITWRRSAWSVLTDGFFPTLDAPWRKLGYSQPAIMSGASHWTMFGGSAWLWLSGLGILITLHLVRTRWLRKYDSQNLPKNS